MLPQIFQYDFMLRAFIAGTIIAILAPLIGSFLLIRRYSLFADALSHVSFLSVAIAVLMDFNPVLVSMIGAVIAAAGLEKLRATKRVQSESSLALFLSGSLALGTIILSFVNASVPITSILFGAITTITESDLYIIAAAGLVAFIGILYYLRELFVLTFDEEYARVKGIRVTLLNYLLMIVSAVIISISITVIGILLITSLMVIPVLTSYQLRRGFTQSVVLSVIFSVVSVWTGIALSFYADLPAGGTIVLILIACFMIALLAGRLFKAKKYEKIAS
jgi:zinc transport system permease protein